jgi:hypothetical protein
VRASHDFVSVDAYRDFITHIIKKLNRRCKGRLAQEQTKLKPLPNYRFMDYTELSVKVTRSSTIVVKRGLYTVPSKLIGETINRQAHNLGWKLFNAVSPRTLVSFAR